MPFLNPAEWLHSLLQWALHVRPPVCLRAPQLLVQECIAQQSTVHVSWCLTMCTGTWERPAHVVSETVACF
jgi:hypothetical protein